MTHITTQEVVDRELRRLVQELPHRTEITPGRLPVVFMMHTSGVRGDQRPFFQIIHGLTHRLPATYHVLVCTAESPNQTLRQLVREVNEHFKQADSGDVVFYGWKSIDKWVSALQSQDVVDAVVTNQHTNLIGGESENADKLRWYRLYRAARQKNAPLIEIEFLYTPGWLTDAMDYDFKDLDKDVAEVDEFHDRCRSLDVPEEEITPWQKHKLPHLLLECFPAELMTEEEIRDARGLIVGAVKPYLSQPDLSEQLKKWIIKCRQHGKPVVLLARGGRFGAPGRDVVSGVPTLAGCLVENG